MFDVFEPVARRLMRQAMLPRESTLRNAVLGGLDWIDALGALPRAGNRLLQRAESGDLFQLHLKDADPMMRQLDRLATRLALSMLVSALIISLGQLIPVASAGGPMQSTVRLGFAVAIGVLFWLFISIIRGTR